MTKLNESDEVQPYAKKHYLQKELYASEWQDMIFPEDLETALDNFNRHCADVNHQIVRYTHRDGSIVWVRYRGLSFGINPAGLSVCWEHIMI